MKRHVNDESLFNGSGATLFISAGSMRAVIQLASRAEQLEISLIELPVAVHVERLELLAALEQVRLAHLALLDEEQQRELVP